MELTGGQIIAEYLAREGVPYLVGIPGHGSMALFDAFKERDDVKVITVRHEQGAAHMADGYFRATGVPLATATSIGPGSTNTIIGAVSAYVDSSAMVLFTGATQTYMYGSGVLQEIERQHDQDFAGMMRPVTKRSWSVLRVDLLPDVLPRAFNWALTGRPGPVHIDLPMDVQAHSADVNLDLSFPALRRPQGRIRPDPDLIVKAVDLLLAAKRPLVLVGGGVDRAKASAALRAFIEASQTPFVTTMMGKGLIPEDHTLCAQHTGANGTLVGNQMSRSADLILAIGTRFSEQTSSSYAPGRSFNIPPTKLAHIDIDPTEIGKNYPVEVGIVSDALTALQALNDELNGRRIPDRSDYLTELAELQAKYTKSIEDRWQPSLLSMSRLWGELRKVLPREAVVLTAAGHPQIRLFQEFPVLEPGGWHTSGGYSTMGWSLPASMGVKLAEPECPVLAIVGDGAFTMTIEELAVAADYHIPVIVVVVNNSGWVSIRDFQRGMFGEERAFAVDFGPKAEGAIRSPDFVAIAKGFGVEAERVTAIEGVEAAIKRALASGGPYVIDIPVTRDPKYSGGEEFGHWDLPVPAYLEKAKQART